MPHESLPFADATDWRLDLAQLKLLSCEMLILCLPVGLEQLTEKEDRTLRQVLGQLLSEPGAPAPAPHEIASMLRLEGYDDPRYLQELQPYLHYRLLLLLQKRPEDFAVPSAFCAWAERQLVLFVEGLGCVLRASNGRTDSSGSGSQLVAASAAHQPARIEWHAVELRQLAERVRQQLAKYPELVAADHAEIAAAESAAAAAAAAVWSAARVADTAAATDAFSRAWVTARIDSGTSSGDMSREDVVAAMESLDMRLLEVSLSNSSSEAVLPERAAASSMQAACRGPGASGGQETSAVDAAIPAPSGVPGAEAPPSIPAATAASSGESVGSAAAEGAGLARERGDEASGAQDPQKATDGDSAERPVPGGRVHEWKGQYMSALHDLHSCVWSAYSMLDAERLAAAFEHRLPLPFPICTQLYSVLLLTTFGDDGLPLPTTQAVVKLLSRVRRRLCISVPCHAVCLAEATYAMHRRLPDSVGMIATLLRRIEQLPALSVAQQPSAPPSARWTPIGSDGSSSVASASANELAGVAAIETSALLACSRGMMRYFGRNLSSMHSRLSQAPTALIQSMLDAYVDLYSSYLRSPPIPLHLLEGGDGSDGGSDCIPTMPSAGLSSAQRLSGALPSSATIVRPASAPAASMSVPCGFGTDALVPTCNGGVALSPSGGRPSSCSSGTSSQSLADEPWRYVDQIMAEAGEAYDASSSAAPPVFAAASPCTAADDTGAAECDGASGERDGNSATDTMGSVTAAVAVGTQTSSEATPCAQPLCDLSEGETSSRSLAIEAALSRQPPAPMKPSTTVAACTDATTKQSPSTKPLSSPSLHSDALVPAAAVESTQDVVVSREEMSSSAPVTATSSAAQPPALQEDAGDNGASQPSGTDLNRDATDKAANGASKEAGASRLSWSWTFGSWWRGALLPTASISARSSAEAPGSADDSTDVAVASTEASTEDASPDSAVPQSLLLRPQPQWLDFGGLRCDAVAAPSLGGPPPPVLDEVRRLYRSSIRLCWVDLCGQVHSNKSDGLAAGTGEGTTDAALNDTMSGEASSGVDAAVLDFDKLLALTQRMTGRLEVEAQRFLPVFAHYAPAIAEFAGKEWGHLFLHEQLEPALRARSSCAQTDEERIAALAHFLPLWRAVSRMNVHYGPLWSNQQLDTALSHVGPLVGAWVANEAHAIESTLGRVQTMHLQAGWEPAIPVRGVWYCESLDLLFDALRASVIGFKRMRLSAALTREWLPRLVQQFDDTLCSYASLLYDALPTSHEMQQLRQAVLPAQASQAMDVSLAAGGAPAGRLWGLSSGLSVLWNGGVSADFLVQEEQLTAPLRRIELQPLLVRINALYHAIERLSALETLLGLKDGAHPNANGGSSASTDTPAPSPITLPTPMEPSGSESAARFAGARQKLHDGMELLCDLIGCKVRCCAIGVNRNQCTCRESLIPDL